MPLEGVPQPVRTYAILLRNSQPEKVHGKPGQALPLPPSRKKIPPGRPPPHNIQVELLRSIVFFVRAALTYRPPVDILVNNHKI